MAQWPALQAVDEAETFGFAEGTDAPSVPPLNPLRSRRRITEDHFNNPTGHGNNGKIMEMKVE